MFNNGKSRAMTCAAIATGLMLMGAPTAQADIINVPGDYPTIQEAIEAAQDGDEIIVAPDTYNEAIDFSGKTITVRSSDGAGVTTIDATGLESTVVTCANFEGAGTALEGFTITGGDGGVRVVGSSLAVHACVFDTNSKSGDGGGLYVFGAWVSLTDCEFSANSASGWGGGMSARDSTIILSNCDFFANISFGGGGLYLSTSSMDIQGCAFVNNTAELGAGGALYLISSAGYQVISGCLFSANEAYDDGGGVYSYGKLTMTNCTFEENEAGGSGGGLHLTGGSAQTVTACIFNANTVTGGGDGGGLNGATNNTIVTDCTFSGNMSFEGGGLWGWDTTVVGCMFIENIAEWHSGGMRIDGAVVDDTAFCDNQPEDLRGEVVLSGVSGCDIGQTGACCITDTCIVATEDACIAAGGEYQGDDTVCEEDTCPEPCPADIDGDGDVDTADLLALLGAWGACP